MIEQFHHASILPFWWRIYFFFRNILVQLHLLKPIYWTFYEKQGIAIGNLQSVKVVGIEPIRRKPEYDGPPIKLTLD